MPSEYDEALKASQMPSTICQRFYQNYFKPLLSVKPSSDYYKFFLGQSELAWRYGVGDGDIKQLLFVSWICSVLWLKDQKDFLTVLTSILNEEEKARLIVTESERHYYESNDSEFEAKAKSALDHYKTIFETGLRLKATVPYFFICKRLGVKNEVKTPEDFVSVSAGEKYNVIKNRTIDLVEGNLSQLVEGFDNSIRNAGGGHDGYELTDNQTIILRITDPKSGKNKGNSELSLEELKKKTDLCRKSLWILTNGLMVFLNNNPEILKKVGPWRKLKIFEVKKFLAEFSYDRWMELAKFEFNETTSLVDVELKQVNKHFGRSSGVLFSNGEKYEVVTVKDEADFEKQTLGILGYLINLLGDSYKVNLIKVKVLDVNGDSVINADYDRQHLVDTMSNGKIPGPKRGTRTDKKYPIYLEFLVKPEAVELTKILLATKGHIVV